MMTDTDTNTAKQRRLWVAHNLTCLTMGLLDVEGEHLIAAKLSVTQEAIKGRLTELTD